MPRLMASPLWTVEISLGEFPIAATFFWPARRAEHFRSPWNAEPPLVV